MEFFAEGHVRATAWRCQGQPEHRIPSPRRHQQGSQEAGLLVPPYAASAASRRRRGADPATPTLGIRSPPAGGRRTGGEHEASRRLQATESGVLAAVASGVPRREPGVQWCAASFGSSSRDTSGRPGSGRSPACGPRALVRRGRTRPQAEPGRGPGRGRPSGVPLAAACTPRSGAYDLLFAGRARPAHLSVPTDSAGSLRGRPQGTASRAPQGFSPIRVGSGFGRRMKSRREHQTRGVEQGKPRVANGRASRTPSRPGPDYAHIAPGQLPTGRQFPTEDQTRNPGNRATKERYE